MLDFINPDELIEPVKQELPAKPLDLLSADLTEDEEITLFRQKYYELLAETVHEMEDELKERDAEVKRLRSEIDRIRHEHHETVMQLRRENHETIMQLHRQIGRLEAQIEFAEENRATKQ